MIKELEGVVKYRSDWKKKPLDLISEEQLQELNFWRRQLMNIGVIGVDTNGLGYGNISFRVAETGQFIISGSQTGHLAQLSPEDLSWVAGFSLEENYIRCSGLRQASSEALTHAVFYQQRPSCRGVMHIHSRTFWQKKQHEFPISSPSAEYGTPELALSIGKILLNLSPADKGIIILGGHPDGIVVFGSTLALAGAEIIKELAKIET